MPTTSTSAARPLTVNPALTLNGSGEWSRTQRPARGPRRRRDDVENPEVAAFGRRIIRAHGRRVAASDVEGLADLLALSSEVERATQEAVDGLRARGYSWTEIAGRLGLTRQAAQQRWGR